MKKSDSFSYLVGETREADLLGYIAAAENQARTWARLQECRKLKNSSRHLVRVASTWMIGIGLLGLIMAYYGGLEGILTGPTKSTDHPSSPCEPWSKFCYTGRRRVI